VAARPTEDLEVGAAGAAHEGRVAAAEEQRARGTRAPTSAQAAALSGVSKALGRQWLDAARAGDVSTLRRCLDEVRPEQRHAGRAGESMR
jgi:hypothetical protein